tara:strand:- start:224 stop:1090 length:867 start_codon:yes stop_codon:yes gene_type:complete
MTVQSIFQYLQDDINNNAEDAKIWRAINSSVRTMCKSYAWSWLRRIKTVTITEDTTQGILMPANMVDVIDPIDDGQGTVFQRVDAALVKNLPTPYRKYFYFDSGGITSLATTDGVSINTDSTALTFDPALPAGDHTGEFIRLTGADGEDWGVHELASNSALVNAYRGKRISGGYYVLRPTTTKRISFTDHTGDRIAASTPVHYWIYPDVLLAPQQELPDIWEQPLKILSAIELTTVTYDKKAEGVRLSMINQYKQEFADAQVADGRPPMVDTPIDNAGRRRNMGWRNQ